MKTPILGQSYVARSINAADNRMVNLFPEQTPEAGKEIGFLNRTPGLEKLVSVGTGPIRGLWTHSTHGKDAYVASGTEFYKILPNYTAQLLGTITGTGPVSIADNGTQLFIACNPDAYVYDETAETFTQVTDTDFLGAVTVCYIDGYFIYNQPDTKTIWATELLNGLAIDPLAFASAESSPDNVVAVIANNREVWVFGSETIEVWYDAATTPFPLAPIQGAYNEIGCIAAFSIAKLDNGLFWLGSDQRGFGIVYRNQGYTGVRVSTHAIEYAIQSYGNISDAIAYTYQQEGHAFYVLTFPTADKTWVFDVATGAWHERAGFKNGNFTRHRSNCQMNFNNLTIVGDFENSNLYSLSLNTYSDNTEEQKWLRSWRALPTGQNNLKRTAHHNLQLDAETGIGLNEFAAYETEEELTTESGEILIDESTNIVTESSNKLLTEASEYIVTVYSDELVTTTHPEAAGFTPECMLRWSDDAGHTWSNEHWASMGRMGSYGTRTIWRRLGMTDKIRDRVYEISGTDPVKIAIMGAELSISPTNS